MGIHQNGKPRREARLGLIYSYRSSHSSRDRFVTHKIDHFATIPTADWRSQDPPIKQQTLRLAAQIREFIRDWNDSDDETVQRENVDKYMTRFGHAALAMRDGLDQHGVRSPELDKLMFEFSKQL